MNTWIKLGSLGVMTIAAVGQAQAVDIKAGDWTVSVGGIVNAYYTQVSCSGFGAVMIEHM